jgi:hypothetical protein
VQTHEYSNAAASRMRAPPRSRPATTTVRTGLRWPSRASPAQAGWISSVQPAALKWRCWRTAVRTGRTATRIRGARGAAPVSRRLSSSTEVVWASPPNWARNGSTMPSRVVPFSGHLRLPMRWIGFMCGNDLPFRRTLCSRSGDSWNRLRFMALEPRSKGRRLGSEGPRGRAIRGQ